GRCAGRGRLRRGTHRRRGHGAAPAPARARRRPRRERVPGRARRRRDAHSRARRVGYQRRRHRRGARRGMPHRDRRRRRLRPGSADRPGRAPLRGARLRVPRRPGRRRREGRPPRGRADRRPIGRAPPGLPLPRADRGHGDPDRPGARRRAGARRRGTRGNPSGAARDPVRGARRGVIGGTRCDPWRRRMNENRLRRHRVGRFALECGHVLEDIEQAYTLTGELNAERDNLVVVFHSLTADADPLRWWGGVVGPGRAIDTDRYAVLCANLLGSCYGTTRPPTGVLVTPRDMVRLVRRLVDDLGVHSVALATGGSLGGMLTLEWVAEEPSLTRAAVVFAAPAAHTAQAIGFNHIQRQVVRLLGVPGLAIARMAAMMTYRTAAEFEARFARERRHDGRFQMQSYLDHQGEKF